MPTRLWSFLVLAPQGLERVRQRGVRGGAGRAEGFGFAEGFFSHGGAPVSFSFPETFGFGKRRVSADAERNRSPRRRRRASPPASPARRGRPSAEATRARPPRLRPCAAPPEPPPPHRGSRRPTRPRSLRNRPKRSSLSPSSRADREEAREQRDERGGFARVPRRRAGDERAHVARQRGEPRAGFVVAVVAVVAEKGAPVVARRRRHGQQSPRAPQRRRTPARSGFRNEAPFRVSRSARRATHASAARAAADASVTASDESSVSRKQPENALSTASATSVHAREPGVARGGARGVVPRAGGTPRYPAVPGQAVRY